MARGWLLLASSRGRGSSRRAHYRLSKQSPSLPSSEIEHARSDIRSTYKQLAERRPITGTKQAREVFGDRVADCLAKWLGCPPDSSASGRALSEAEAEAKIAELGKLSSLGYAKARAKAAKEIGLQPAELDKLVKKLGARVERSARRQAPAGRSNSRREPWGEEVSGADLLDRLATQLREYVVMTLYQALGVALWVIHAHTHDACDSPPKLIIKSQQKRSGKTRLVEVLARLVLVRSSVRDHRISFPAPD